VVQEKNVPTGPSSQGGKVVYQKELSRSLSRRNVWKMKWGCFFVGGLCGGKREGAKKKSLARRLQGRENVSRSSVWSLSLNPEDPYLATRASGRLRIRKHCGRDPFFHASFSEKMSWSGGKKALRCATSPSSKTAHRRGVLSEKLRISLSVFSNFLPVGDRRSPAC